MEELSKYVPVAVNCGLVPGATDEFAGVTAMETNGLVTVRAAVPETDPEVAVMVTLPGATPVARPPVPMVAIRLFGRLPGRGRGQILSAGVSESSDGGVLLSSVGSDRSRGRRDRDRNQRIRDRKRCKADNLGMKSRSSDGCRRAGSYARCQTARCDGSAARSAPGDGGSQVLGTSVTVVAGGGELLGPVGCNCRVRGSHGDGLQGDDGQGGRTGDAARRSRDRGGASAHSSGEAGSA